VRPTEEGRLIIQTLHNNLVAVLQEQCPPTCKTVEQRALWQAAHDARKRVLLDLTLQAVKGSKLAAQIQAHKPPTIKGVQYAETG
jgi:hypothetical protein